MKRFRVLIAAIVLQFAAVPIASADMIAWVEADYSGTASGISFAPGDVGRVRVLAYNDTAAAGFGLKIFNLAFDLPTAGIGVDGNFSNFQVDFSSSGLGSGSGSITAMLAATTPPHDRVVDFTADNELNSMPTTIASAVTLFDLTFDIGAGAASGFHDLSFVPGAAYVDAPTFSPNSIDGSSASTVALGTRLGPGLNGFEVTAVPEPTGFLLLAAAMATTFCRRRRTWVLGNSLPN